MDRYRIKKSIPDNIQKELSEYSPFLQQLLYNRGIETKEEAEVFLNPSYEEHLHDPFLLNDMDKAVERILSAIERNEHISIYSDYDCDGIPGAVVLHDFFKNINYQHFSNFIPHRHYDGFGLSEPAVEKLAEEGVQLIITIDCGTTDIKAVKKAKELGVDVIITDHHQAKEVLPDAAAIVNPQIGEKYPFTGLCGAGVIFKVVQALLQKGEFDFKDGMEKWYLDMVGLATIADMVPLIDENRALAYYGLRVLQKSRRPGLQQLLKKQRVEQRYITEDDIGFVIGPRINASSRMGVPEDAFGMLATDDVSKAGMYLEHLEKLNTQRKTEVTTITKSAHKKIKILTKVPDVIVLGDSKYRPSLVGLTASKLAEEYNRPTFVWGRDGNGCIKGSCRSNGTISVITLMEAVSDHLLGFGGHHMAGGFEVDDIKIHTLSKEMNDAYKRVSDVAHIDVVHDVDLELALDEVTPVLLQEQKRLAPFGEGNKKPLYKFKDVHVQEVSLFGKGKEHTKLQLETSGCIKEAIAFFKKPDEFTISPESEKKVTLLAYMEESYFMGRLQVRLRLVDVL